MDSPNRPRNHEVDELRGAAALLVLFYHSVHSGAVAIGIPEWLTTHWVLPAVLYEGHTGVALFMVLSGYILATGTFDRKIIYREFIRNRVLRIFPLMIVVLVFSLYAARGVDLGKILAPFMLLANTGAVFSDSSGLAGTVWTISVEFQFYLIAPFLFAFTGRNGLKFVLPIILLFFLLRIIVLLPTWDDKAELFRITYFTIVGRINQFMIGIGLAYLFHSGHLALDTDRTKGGVALLISSAGVVTLLAVLNHSGGITSWHFWRIVYPEVEAALWASFIAAYLIAKPLKGVGLDRLLYGVGQISFSLYILHYAIQREFWIIIYPMFFTGWISSIYGVFAASVLIAAAMSAISALSYLLIEKPFIDMRGRYFEDRDALKMPPSLQLAPIINPSSRSNDRRTG